MSTPKLHIPDEFSAASKEQRIAFVQELWDQIAEDPANVPIPTHHKRVIDERLESFRQDPNGGESWTEARDRLLAKLRES